MPTATLVSAGNREQNNGWRIFNWRSKMATSKITTQRVSRWTMGLMAVALLLIPAEFMSAQDYDAVIKRLRQAVAAREISTDQADAMIGALKNSTANKLTVAKPAASAKLNWDAIEKKIEGAVKTGKLTRQQADAHYLALKKQTAKKPSVKKADSKPKSAVPAKPTVKKDVSKAKIDWEAAKNKIEGAVKEGKLTRQQADAHYLALKKQTAQKPAVKKADSKPKSAVPAKPAVKKDASKAKIDWEAIKHRIESGVKAGKLTREQADAMYLELKKQYRPKPDTSSKPDVKKDNQPDPRIAFDQVAKEIRAAVEAGKITAEQGRARLAAYRKHLAERQEKEAPKDVKSAPQEQRRIQEIKIRNVNGVKNIYVTENDRKITIIDDPDRGIKIEITDNKDGKPATRTFQANNIAELQKKSPEAYKLYQKYSKYAPSGK
jgi:polyhydroxyalkanoate synthesis regulator phasin